jgi:hypothetical protein
VLLKERLALAELQAREFDGYIAGCGMIGDLVHLVRMSCGWPLMNPGALEG